MEGKRRSRIISVAISSALALCMFGGVVALGACKGDGDAKNKEISIEYSYTPERGNGKTYYVSADVAQRTADDHNGSYDDPYNILDLLGWGSSGNPNNDYDILKAGDTVLVKPGQYEQDTSVCITINGTYDNYITVMNAAYADDGHTYDSTSATISLYKEAFDGNNRGVTINADYIYWYGIDVAGAGDNGMYIGGNHNVIENCQFYNNRDTGLQLGRKSSSDTDIKSWPSYNLIKNCTSFNNYDNETYGENADGFGAKLTIGYGNMFDGCIAYRNSDDGWDLYAKEDTGNIGCVIIYNCLAFENGYLLDTQENCNARFPTFSSSAAEANTNQYTTRDGDGNGFKLGGGSNEGDVKLYNCMTFNNRMHGVTDNSNPGTLQIDSVTSYNNCASIDPTAPVKVEVEIEEEGGEPADGSENTDEEGDLDDDETEVEEDISTFGQIKYDGGTGDSDCANIDLSRWSYSYNTMANVLSVIDGNSETANDAYRGATTNCMFNNYYVEGTVDADSKNNGGIKGISYKQASASDIFVETPALDLGVRTSFDEKGVVNLKEGNIHSELREADGTINVGNMLKIKSGASLALSGVGADLSKKSWDEYTHYEYTCGQSSKSAEADTLTAISNMIYLPVNEDAIFQNFKVVDSIWGVNINWTSSDSDVLRVTKNITYTTSNSSTVGIEVDRDSAGDRNVSLTAEFAYGGYTMEKEYNLVVRKDIPSIGDVVVDGVVYDQAIVDQYAAFPVPAVTIENGSDYNGKILDESLYTITTTYEYAPTAADTFDEIGVFTTSNAGVYRITLDISIDNPDELAAVTQKTYTYLIYVASKDASVTFVNDAMTLTVNRDGYEISGDLSSPTGYSYILRTDTALTGSGTNGEVLATDVIEASNVIKKEFRTTSLSLLEEDPNDSGYFVYCVLTSLDGTEISPVYKQEAKVEKITTCDAFVNALSSNNSYTIYLLKSDLDFTNTNYTAPDKNFVGLLNGLGHTISNLTTTGQYIIKEVRNGTIENIRFSGISIGSENISDNVSGIIGTVRGGYLYNIEATNVNVVTNGQQVGGIVGRVYADSDKGSTTYISQVSLVNEYEHEFVTDGSGVTSASATGCVISGTERIGGIVGYITAGNAGGWTKVYIDNCYCNAYVVCSNGVAGGIIGRIYNRNVEDDIEVDKCFTYGLIESTRADKAYLGGIIGQFDASGKIRVTDCMSYGNLSYGNEYLSGSLKNASWIIGNFVTNGDILVTGCFARHAEYNEEYGVSTSIVMWTASSWERYCPFDMESGYWEFVTEKGGTAVEPYIRHIFQTDPSWETSNGDGMNSESGDEAGEGTD